MLMRHKKGEQETHKQKSQMPVLVHMYVLMHSYYMLLAYHKITDRAVILFSRECARSSGKQLFPMSICDVPTWPEVGQAY